MSPREGVLWTPNLKEDGTPGPQYKFLSCPELETLYGGAKGGGKSDALLMAAVKDFRSEWLRAIIFRRSFPELKDLVRRSRKLYPALGGRYRSSTKEWLFPSGAIVEFGYLESEEDLERYQGRAFTFIGFDEVAQLGDESYYTTMLSCLRAPMGATGIKLRCMSTCNPIGAGRLWVKNRFGVPDDGSASQVYDWQTKSWRVFIPAKIIDNPHLAGTNYHNQLNALPERIRRNLRDGRWDTIEGAMWPEFDKEIHTCKPFVLPSNARIWRGADDGYNAPAAVLWFAQVDRRIFIIRELYASGMTSEQMAEKVLSLDKRVRIQKDDGSVGYNEKTLHGTIDSSAFNEHDGPTRTGRAQRMNDLGCYWSPCVKGPNSRVAGWNMITSKLTNKLMDGLPELIIFDTCKTLISAVPVCPCDKDDPEDIDPDFKLDHILDAWRYGLGHRWNNAKAGKVSGT